MGVQIKAHSKLRAVINPPLLLVTVAPAPGSQLLPFSAVRVEKKRSCDQVCGHRCRRRSTKRIQKEGLRTVRCTFCVGSGWGGWGGVSNLQFRGNRRRGGMRKHGDQVMSARLRARMEDSISVANLLKASVHKGWTHLWFYNGPILKKTTTKNRLLFCQRVSIMRIFKQNRSTFICNVIQNMTAHLHEHAMSISSLNKVSVLKF